jgi:hypothetical protein
MSKISIVLNVLVKVVNLFFYLTKTVKSLFCNEDEFKNAKKEKMQIIKKKIFE